MGDPSVASEPSDPYKFYAVGMVYCNPYNPKGEIYFCKNTGSPDNVSNWSCSILPPNDNWAYFKDKPWIIALGRGVILVNYTTDKYGNYEILQFKLEHHKANGCCLNRRLLLLAHHSNKGLKIYG
jgi:hypothetical protein